MEMLRLLDYGALGAAMLVLLMAMSLHLAILRWTESLLDTVLGRVEENTQMLLGLADIPQPKED